MAKQFELLRRIGAHSQSRGVIVTLTSVALMLSLTAPTAAVRLTAPDAHALKTSRDIEIMDGNFGLGMRLDSVAIRSFDLDDDEEEFVLFCFRDRVQRILDDGFFVAGFASGARQDASILKILQTDTDCVLAGFPAGTDLGQFSVGGVAPGVVRNVDGEINLPDTVVLDGSNPSFSSGPVLVAVDNLNRTLNRASLVFDENLAETDIDPDGFGYYTRSGIAHRADRIVSVKNDIVVVEWDEADEVEDGVRFFAEEAAIQSRQGFPSFTGSVGGDTSAPDLEDVGRVAVGVWAFRFDEPVTALDAGGFVLYTQNGDRFEGDDADSDDRGTIHVTFDDLATFDDQVIHAASESGAARGINAGGSVNTIGSIVGDPDGGFDRVGRLDGGLGRRGTDDLRRARTPDRLDRSTARRDSLGRDDAFGRSRSRSDSFDRAQGFGRLDRSFEGTTAGPDLIDVDIDESAGLVGYRFDQYLGDGATFDSDRFFLLTPAGELVLGRSIDDADDDLVVILFGQALTEDALAAGVLDMAVSDERGNENLARTVDDLGTQGFGLRRNGDRSRGGGTFD